MQLCNHTVDIVVFLLFIDVTTELHVNTMTNFESENLLFHLYTK